MPHTATHRLEAFAASVQCFILFAALLDQHCLRFCVCCCCGGWFRCFPPRGRFSPPCILPSAPLPAAAYSGFVFAPLKVPTPVCTILRMQMFFLGFPWYTIRVASAYFSTFMLNSSACCFMEGATPIFTCPKCQPGWSSLPVRQWPVLRPTHTAQTSNCLLQPLSDHSVALCLTR